MSDNQPWWNDQDKVGGAVATIVLMTAIVIVAIIAIALAIRLADWIIS